MHNVIFLDHLTIVCKKRKRIATNDDDDFEDDIRLKALR